MWSQKIKSFKNDKIKISGNSISVKKGEIDQGDLKYWVKNPRIYSIVHGSISTMNQKEIQKTLQSYEHVKQLRKDILHHGGLINPIIVIDGSLEVLEGNSRLAAIRSLSKNEPVKFGKVDCLVLPKETSKKIIYSYLNQEHIKGKHQWSKYEQAGLIYRLVIEEGEKNIDTLSNELGLSKRKAKSMYDIYDFMIQNKEDNPTKYSYYEVYLSNRKANKLRETETNLDKKIIKEIKEANVTALEFRTILPHVLEHQKERSNFISGKKSLLGAFETLEQQGKTEDLVRKLKRMKEQISEFQKSDFDGLTAKAQKDAEFNLSKIITAAQNLKKKVYG